MKTKKKLTKLSADDFSSVVQGLGGAGSVSKSGSAGSVSKSGSIVEDTGIFPGMVHGLNTGGTGNTGGSSGTGNTGGTGGFDFKKAVRSPYDISELNSYLYDSGLQNVFKDYQENIASLNASEQQSLEDAYYIREMSKKYLGEYASNLGIGDVSGNLLDIYGNYQKNKADIMANYDALELNLTQEYRAEKTALFNEKMKEQYKMELADFEEGSQEIMFNAVTGNYDTELYADEWEYLNAMKESGELSKDDYQLAYGTLYSTMIDRIKKNLENENYEGFENAEEYINSFGNLIAADKSMLQGISKQIDKQNRRMDVIKNLITKNYGEGVEGLDYLESVRDIIGPELYQQHYASIYADLYQEAFGDENGIKYFDPETMTIDEYVQSYVDKGLSSAHAKELKEYLTPIVERYEAAKIDPTIGYQDSEKYIGDDYNFHVNTGGENVGKGSYMYQDAKGNRTFAVLDDSEKDGEVSGWYASHEDLMKTFRDENDGKNPNTGDEVEFSAYNENTEETQTFSYVYQNGRFYRLVQENFIDPTDMMKWKNTEGTGKWLDYGRKITTGDDFEIDNRYDGKGFLDLKDWNEPDTFTYKGKKYVESDAYYDSELDKLFNKIHGVVSKKVGKNAFAAVDDSEAEKEVSGWYASHEDLMEAFRSENNGSDPINGHGVLFSAQNAETGETQEFGYIYEDGRFHRLVPENSDAVVYYDNNFYIRKADGRIYKMKEE